MSCNGNKGKGKDAGRGKEGGGRRAPGIARWFESGGTTG